MGKSSDEKMQTLLVSGKPGIKIPLKRYELMRDTMLGILAEYPEISYKELVRLIHLRVEGMMDGSIMWLLETVKNDLLGRRIIKKTSQSPVMLKIADDSDLV